MVTLIGIITIQIPFSGCLTHLFSVVEFETSQSRLQRSQGAVFGGRRSSEHVLDHFHAQSSGRVTRTANKMMDFYYSGICLVVGLVANHLRTYLRIPPEFESTGKERRGVMSSPCVDHVESRHT